jgi:hypothetical protein
MSTPITEAHREAAVSIFDLAMKSAHHGAPFREPCAQLIADSEAKACDQLRAEVERFKAAFADPHALHAHCLRTLTDGQIAHLFGERMTEIANRAEKAEDRADKAEAALASPPLLTGKLTHAGTCYIGEEHTDGVFIAIDREQLKALPRLPMYEHIELRSAMKNETKTS